MREQMLERLAQAQKQTQTPNIWDIDPSNVPEGIRISPERLARLRLALRNTLANSEDE